MRTWRRSHASRPWCPSAGTVAAGRALPQAVAQHTFLARLLDVIVIHNDPP
ncbi:hypothetical protein ABZ897_43385 [Nonomuraea sp. NPDC046802]|uniref:hypothetical protein n=1 Tax=Nonomuraea sp. NPDC046802 TaxID=3154919 RepID=UPI0033E10670